MTWEWVVLLSVMMVLGVVVLFIASKESTKGGLCDSISDLDADVSQLKQTINKFSADHAAIKKQVEETQKLLSQQQLAKSFRTIK